MERYLNAAGIAREDSIAVGDGPNDLQTVSYTHLDVAMQSGYQNVSYFIRSFQKAYAVSPLKYRKNNYSR